MSEAEEPTPSGRVPPPEEVRSAERFDPDQRVRFSGPGATALALWAAGAQLNEALAAAGMGATALWAIVDGARALRTASARAEVAPWLRRSFWPVALWILWVFGSGLLGHGVSGTGVARTLDWVALPFAAWTAARISPRGRRAVLGVALGVLLLSSIAAGLQHFGWWPSPEAFTPLRWTKIGFHRVFEPIPGTERFMAGGLIFHRLKFAHVGSLVVLIALVVGLRAVGRDRLLCLGAAAVGAIAILSFPYARAASAALVLTAALTVVIVHPRRKIAFGLAGAFLVVALAAVALTPALRARFLRAATAAGSGDRHELLASGMRAVRTHPFVGTGSGQFRHANFAAPQAPANVREHPGKTHNQLLSLAAETGLLGAALFVLMLAWLGRALWRGGTIGLAGLACLGFFALLALTHDPLFHAEYSLGLVLALGVGLSGTVPRTGSA